MQRSFSNSAARLAVVTALLPLGASAASGQVDRSRPRANAERLRNPVVLVHGINDTSTSMRAVRKSLSARGWEVHAIDLQPNDGSAGLEDLGSHLASYVRRRFPTDRKIDLVGFSMGGMVARYYLQELGGVNQVQRFVTIAAPNNGTWLAHLSNKRGCVQMRPGSAFLRALNAKSDSLRKLQVTCLWTPLDLMILPAKSSRLPYGAELKTTVLAHPLMVRNAGCLRAIARALEAQS